MVVCLSNHDALLSVKLQGIDYVILSELDAKLNVDVVAVNECKLIKQGLYLVCDALIVKVERHIAVAEVVEERIGKRFVEPKLLCICFLAFVSWLPDSVLIWDGLLLNYVKETCVHVERD